MQTDRMTMADIAALVGVTRQAVTNWRRRSSLSASPFPSPLANGASVEEFAREEVLSWLEKTGRTRDADTRMDAQAFCPPDTAELADVVTALALRVEAGEDLGERSAAELNAIAAEVDAANEYLRSEVTALAGRRDLFTYVDELLAVAYGPRDALDRLRTTRLQRWRGERALSDAVIELLASMAATCRDYLGEESALALAMEPADSRVARGFTSVIVDDSCSRELRRHLLLEEVPFVREAPGVVRVTSLVGQPVETVLQNLDLLAVELAPGQLAVVLGPASALCDRLRGQAAKNRSETLRADKLVAAFRLPRGMWREAHRQALGLWMLRGGARPQRLVAGDLTSAHIDLADLSADIFGALEQSAGRAYRYGRALDYALALTRPVLVPSGLGPARVRSTQSTSRDAVTAATLVTQEPLDGFDVLVERSEGTLVSTPRSLGQLVDSKQVKVISGSRINLSHAEEGATLPVLTAEPGKASLSMDPLVAAEHYLHAQRTEPGDVVFTLQPRPAAVVDSVGGALVLSPSRMLRVTEGTGIGPLALATLINQLPEGSGEWRTWPVPRLTTQQIADVEATLEAAERHFAELRRRETAMRHLVQHLIQGVADGDLVISSTAPRKAG